MEKLTALVALITSGISAIVAIYNTVFKNGQRRLDNYYKDFVRPFVVAYKKNPEINVIDYLKPILKYDNDNVPKYVFKLFEGKDSMRLKKVLLCDYVDLYKNEENGKTRILDGFLTLIHFAMFIISIIFVFFATDYFAKGILIILGEIGLKFEEISLETAYGNGWMVGLSNILGALILMIMIRVMMSFSKMFSLDRYVIKRKKIDSIVKEKVKRYDKYQKKWYI